ncbi:MAG: DNA methyltransferase [Devosia sp.]
MKPQFIPIVEHRDPRSLHPNPRTARKHTDKKIHKLAAMIGQSKLVTPLFIDREGIVLAGHARWQAALELELEMVPVIVVDHLTKAQARLFAIGDNRIALEAEWDLELLASEFTELSLPELNLDLSLTGFETGEIDSILSGVSDEDKPDPADRVPAIDRSVPSITQLGELWQLGQHRAFIGNSLEPSSFEVLMDGEVAHQVLSDFPYNVPIDGHVGGLGKLKHDEFAMAAGEMSSDQFQSFNLMAIQLIQKHVKDGAILMIFMDWRHQEELLGAARSAKLELKNICVWDKVNGGMGSLYRGQHEFVLVFKHGSAPHTNNVQLGATGRYRTNIWRYPGASMFRKGRKADLAVHPTVKPVALLMDAICDCSKHSEIILDPFGGSGSTMLAAERVGRRCRIIEIDPYYMDTAIRRWQKMTGKQATKVETGETFDKLATRSAEAA